MAHRIRDSGAVIAFRPRENKKAARAWPTLAAATAAFAVWNAMTVNSLGGNDPRYRELAREFESLPLSREAIATNLFFVLDMHAHFPSVVTTQWPRSKKYRYCFGVEAPSYDAISSTVLPMNGPVPDGWELQSRLRSGTFYVRRETSHSKSVSEVGRGRGGVKG